MVGKIKGELKLIVMKMNILRICKIKKKVKMDLFFKVMEYKKDWKVKWKIINC